MLRGTLTTALLKLPSGEAVCRRRCFTSRPRRGGRLTPSGGAGRAGCGRARTGRAPIGTRHTHGPTTSGTGRNAAALGAAVSVRTLAAAVGPTAVCPAAVIATAVIATAVVKAAASCIDRASTSSSRGANLWQASTATHGEPKVA